MKVPAGNTLLSRIGNLAVVALVVAGCQTVGLDRTETITGKWEGELARFAAEDASAKPKQGGILLVGSSSFRLWTNASAALPEHRVINRGFGGSQMHDLLALTDRLVWPYAPHEILVYEGDNDLVQGVPPSEIAKEFRKFAHRVHRRLPEARIRFVSIKPSPSRAHLMAKAAAANEEIKHYCTSRPWLRYCDVFTPMLNAEGNPRKELFAADNLHLNREGYTLWTAVIRRDLGLDPLTTGLK